MSPELLLQSPYNFKSDIWSVGCILYEMCALKPPFRGTSLRDLCNKIQRGIYEPLNKYYSKELSIILSTIRQITPITNKETVATKNRRYLFLLALIIVQM